MEIYLVRHTTPDVANGVCYGQADIGLTSSFDAESKKVVQCLPRDIDVVYSSPLSRCLLLARLIAVKQVVQDARLTEMDFGKWELKRWDEIDRSDLEVWMKDYVHAVPPGGESMQQMNNRVKDFWKDIQKQNHQKIAVVTHGGVIRLLIAQTKRMPLEKIFGIEAGYGEVVKLEV